MLRKSRIPRTEPELDITSFMSLMIVLVPVLLVMMVFSHITVLELKLPDAVVNSSADQPEPQLELLATPDRLQLYYPAGALLKDLPLQAGQYDFALLQQALKEVKFLLAEQQKTKKDIVLQLSPELDYQTIVHLMDAVRSYPTVVAANLVDAELFPDISLADAPSTTAATEGAR